MNNIKHLQAGILTRTYTYKKKHYFTTSLLWGFKLDSGDSVMEQDLWKTIAESLGKNALFDIGMPKIRGEFLIYGSAYAASEKKASVILTSLHIGKLQKVISIFGNRHWISPGGLSISISDPEPFSSMPFTYANAFGGKGFGKNPEGKGYTSVKTESGEKHELPNSEYPSNLIGSPHDRPLPASYGRVDIMREQRISKAGTYDQKYIKECMPGLPDDINWEYFNDAAEDQWIEGYFTGNESFDITGMHPSTKILYGKLPGVYGRCFVNRKFGENIEFKELITHLDTLCFFPDKNMGVLIHRGTIEVTESDGADITDILIAHENIKDHARPFEHYKEEMRKRTDKEEAFKSLLNTVPLLPEGYQNCIDKLTGKEKFPLEMLSSKNMATFSNKKKQEADVLINKEIERLKDSFNQIEQTTDIEQAISKLDNIKNLQVVETPETIKIKELMENILPGINGEPENIDISKINFKGFDNLNSFIRQLADEKKKQADELILKETERFKKEAVDNPEMAKAAEQMELAFQKSREPPPLPRINTKQQMAAVELQFHESIAPQLVQLKAMGVPDEQLAKMNINFDEMQKNIEDSSVKIKELYRFGAHYTGKMCSPHPGQEPGKLADLISKFLKNETVEKGDYAFVDFSGQTITNCNISDSYLEYTTFVKTVFKGCDFSKCILAHAIIDNAVFENCNFNSANLGNSNLTKSTFINCDFTDGIIGKTYLDNVHFINCTLTGKMEMFLEIHCKCTIFENCRMPKNIFLDTDLSSCSFIGSDLTESNFLNPVLQNTIFDESILAGVNFVKTTGSHASFENAKMKNVRFVGSCSLTDCKFNRSYAPEANFRDCILIKADFTQATLDKADFSGADCSGALFVKALLFQSQFNKTNLSDAKLQRANLMEATLYKARLVGADFFEANCYSTNFFESIQGETNFTDANLDQTLIKNWREGQ